MKIWLAIFSLASVSTFALADSTKCVNKGGIAYEAFVSEPGGQPFLEGTPVSGKSLIYNGLIVAKETYFEGQAKRGTWALEVTFGTSTPVSLNTEDLPSVTEVYTTTMTVARADGKPLLPGVAALSDEAVTCTHEFQTGPPAQ